MATDEQDAERRIENQALERARAAGPPWQALIEILRVCRALAETDDFVHRTPDVVTRGIEDIERHALAGLS